VNFEEYLTRFRLIQLAVEKDEKMLELYQGKAYGVFLRHFGSTHHPALSRHVLTPDALEQRLQRKKRLAERYAVRIARACDRIETLELREYAIYHFLYGMTHEDLAERSQFCVRTVYRQGKLAKKELEKALLSVMPKPKKIPPRRFLVQSPISLRKYAVDRIARSVAAASARRRAAAPITSASFYRDPPTPLRLSPAHQW